MNLEDIREYCIRKKGVTESFPFDDQTLVFKVMGKIFLITNINEVEISVNLKCDPEFALQLREKYKSVLPGFHMNKKYWNTVEYSNEFSDQEFYSMIDHSYHQVVKGMPGKKQQELENLL